MEKERLHPRRRKPSWLKKSLPRGNGVRRVEKILDHHRLHTVCRGARCPNRNDCYQEGTATFLIMGDVCTRRCSFCSIPARSPDPLDRDEPDRLARAAEKMGLSYVVVTSVTRDDLSDGGASHFAAVTEAIRRVLPEAQIELLVPDFKGDLKAVDRVLAATPTVFNHNVETLLAFYDTVRPEADYDRSLRVLAHAARRGSLPVKSGFMLGLGEADDDVRTLLADLKRSGVGIVTIGQYLKPAKDCLDVVEYVPPERFDTVASWAREIGFGAVASGPFVRSSYRAAELAREAGIG